MVGAKIRADPAPPAAAAATLLPRPSLAEALTGETTGVLLFVSSNEETAKRVESSLRNMGHPLRTAWVTDLEDLEDVLRRNPPDLVLCDHDVEKAPQPKVVALCARHRPDLPVILVSIRRTLENTVDALAMGAQDVVSYGDPKQLEHLELVVIREFLKHFHMRDLRRTQDRLHDYQSRHQQLTESTGDAVARLNEGIVSSTNTAFAHLLGHDDNSELVGQPMIDLVIAEQQTKVKERLRAVAKGKHNGDPLELAFIGKSGNVPVKAQLILGNEEGERVIELLIRAEGGKGKPPSTHLALHDRYAFIDAMKNLPKASNSVSGAILAKLDGFEALEARIGHAAAQQLTALVSGAIHARLGPQDQSFAFSVDEIAMLVHRNNFSEIEQFANFLLKEIAGQIFTTREHEAQVTLTIVMFPLSAQDNPSEVITQLVTETRKISAKNGNLVSALGATAKAHQTEREEARKAAQVKKALEENRLTLAYQSIASLEGESRSHFDILVRMIDDAGKEWHAGEFLSAAARFNLMKPIDRWVTMRTLGIVEKRAASSEVPVLFVKLSEETLKDSDAFVTWLAAQTKNRPMKNDEVVFELRELSLQNQVRKAKSLTTALRELGAGIAIEHFGVGAGSAQMIDHIPANFIKFHPSFTQKFNDKPTQKKLTDLVEVAKHKGIKTIVSHVEDAHVMARLWQMGVNFIQGYHVQEPEVVLLASEVRATASS